ncbi:TATA-binding protein-associated factor BTAF1-like isoform X2 [Humulus lupulus]|uniref:TATA-binding protein-associated factor BTAF1-like isoform X2 n=1 Tax=Humulus lupulus TaxID=3486 RepID=UPI002B4120E5|nr:TATA-binding protein-associated factor BTAF1-like isoform X2 [Humulus lupulus]
MLWFTNDMVLNLIGLKSGRYLAELLGERQKLVPFIQILPHCNRLISQVWEVRHGSVMALREILTHQGASAGVFMPDLSFDGAQFFQLEDEFVSHRMKREREIDLNMQGPTDEFEPNMKMPKFTDVSSPWVDTMTIANIDCNSDINIKVEDGSMCDLLAEPITELSNLSSVKVESDSHLDTTLYSTKEDTTLYSNKEVTETAIFEDSSSIKETDVMKNISENSELMNWIKLARHSWLKNCQFLQECAIRFLCVLSLDRFGDYVSDQVVAPVRETCAQALGVVFKYMHPTSLHETLTILLEMQVNFIPKWEILQGSLLGIKYLVAVRKEILHELLGRVLPACKAGLEDPDDDVRAVAADALIPTAAAIVSLQGQTLNSIVMLLWDILLDLDDLSPSTSSVMNLLAEIYSQDEIIPKMLGSSKDSQEFDLYEVGFIDDSIGGMSMQENPFMLATLAPRLWPFMRHSIASVRYSAIRTLRLLEAGYKRNISDSCSSSFWPSFILGDTLRIVFQNLLLDSNDEILQCSERVWRLLVQSPKEDLEIAARSYMSSWIELASTPYGSVLDATKMFWPVALPRKSHFRAAAKMRAVNLENESHRNIPLESTNGAIPHERIGDDSINPVKIIVGTDVEMSVTRTRVVTATALGIFASMLEEGSTQYVVDPLSSALTSMAGVQRQVASMILISWFKEIKSGGSNENQGTTSSFPNHLRNWLLDLLACSDPTFPTKNSLLPYLELSRTYSKMRGEASQLLHTMESLGMFDNSLSITKPECETLSVDDAISFASKVPALCNDNVGNESVGHLEDMESARQRLLTTSGYLKCVQINLHVSVSALVAAAVVWMLELPAQLNPIILPLMASIRREQEERLQEKAAEALAELIYYCISRKPSPNDKLIKNVCSLTCMDPCETPQAAVIGSMEIIDDQDLLSFGTATNKQKTKGQMIAGGEDRSKVEGFIGRRGSELALKHLCDYFHTKRLLS